MRHFKVGDVVIYPSSGTDIMVDGNCPSGDVVICWPHRIKADGTPSSQNRPDGLMTCPQGWPEADDVVIR